MTKSERHPFPPLYGAREKWGERIFYLQPNYASAGCCRWCGKRLSGRRKSFCSDECSKHFNDITVWHRGRDPYSLRILYRDNFTCPSCGRDFSGTGIADYCYHCGQALDWGDAE